MRYGLSRVASLAAALVLGYAASCIAFCLASLLVVVEVSIRASALLPSLTAQKSTNCNLDTVVASNSRRKENCSTTARLAVLTDDMSPAPAAGTYRGEGGRRGGRFVSSRIELMRRLTFSSFRTTKCLRCCFSLGFWQKSLFCVDRTPTHDTHLRSTVCSQKRVCGGNLRTTTPSPFLWPGNDVTKHSTCSAV